MTTKINVVPGARRPLSSDERRDLELPFHWHSTVSPGDVGRDVHFRFPAPDDPKPGSRRLLGMSLCACVLGMAGLIVTIRTLVVIVSGPTPGWFGPMVACAALAGVLPTIGAFLSIHRRRLPWLLLVAAVPPLAAAAALTTAAP